MEKLSLLPIFVFSFLFFFENATHLTTLLTTNSKGNFLFLFLFPRHHLEASMHIPVMPYWYTYAFISSFLFICCLFSLRAQRNINCLKFIWRKPNGIYWTKNKAEYNKIWRQC